MLRSASLIGLLLGLSACAALIGLEDTTTIEETAREDAGGTPPNVPLADAAPEPAIDADARPACDEDGLVARFKLDEGSGTLVRDCTSNAIVGTVNNLSWTTSGTRPNGAASALRFAAGWVTVADRNAFALTAALTLTAWIRVDKATGATQYVVGRTNGTGGGNPTKGFRLAVDKDRSLALFLGNNAIFEPQGGPLITVGTWTHIAATYSPGGAVILYRDGVPELTTKTGLPPRTEIPADDFQLGARSDGSYPFNGLMNDVRVYNRALVASEIAALMQ